VTNPCTKNYLNAENGLSEADWTRNACFMSVTASVNCAIHW